MKYIILIVLIILMIYSYILYSEVKIYNNFITGFWKCDSGFCKESEIDDMVLYLNTNDNTGYLIITKDGELLDNSSFDISKKTMNSFIPFNSMTGSQYMKYMINFNSDNPDFVWGDEKYTLLVSMVNGTILIYKNDILFSKLYKDNNISNKFIEYAILDDETE